MAGLMRHPSLQPFSREHHFFLVHARNLWWAQKRDCEVGRVCDDFLDFWKNTGARHFFLEENVFIFKEVKNPDTYPLEEAYEVYWQHQHIRTLVRELREKRAFGLDLQMLVREISESLEKNIRYEERVFFELVQKSLDQSELESLKEDREKWSIKMEESFKLSQ